MPWWGQILIVLSAVIIGSAVAVVLLRFGVKALVKARLVPTALYCLVAWVSTFITGWAKMHMSLVIFGFCAILGLTIISWIVTLVKHIRYNRFVEEDIALQIKDARNRGFTHIGFDENGNLLDPTTGDPVDCTNGKSPQKN